MVQMALSSHSEVWACCCVFIYYLFPKYILYILLNAWHISHTYIKIPFSKERIAWLAICLKNIKHCLVGFFFFCYKLLKRNYQVFVIPSITMVLFLLPLNDWGLSKPYKESETINGVRRRHCKYDNRYKTLNTGKKQTQIKTNRHISNKCNNGFLNIKKKINGKKIGNDIWTGIYWRGSMSFKHILGNKRSKSKVFQDFQSHS